MAIYLEGLYQCDTELLAGVFHPQAVYATASEATPLILGLNDYLPIVAKREPPARSNAPRSEEVMVVDVVGQSTAMVKLRCQFFQRNYIDFLTLIKVEGEWRIISKVFHFDPVI